MKVVYNGCFGGFGLSYAGIMRFAELKGIKLWAFIDNRDKNGDIQFGKMRPYDPAKDGDKGFLCIHYCTSPEYSNDTYWRGYDMDRGDPALVQVVEEMGEQANGMCAKLKIEDVPAGTLWRIDEYDGSGSENVMTQSDYEWKIAI